MNMNWYIFGAIVIITSCIVLFVLLAQDMTTGTMNQIKHSHSEKSCDELKHSYEVFDTFQEGKFFPDYTLRDMVKEVMIEKECDI